MKTVNQLLNMVGRTISNSNCQLDISTFVLRSDSRPAKYLYSYQKLTSLPATGKGL